MKWLLALTASLILAGALCASGQGLTASEKAVLDLYYLTKTTNNIPGSYLVDQSVAAGKIINTGLTAVTVFGGVVTGRYDNLVYAIQPLPQATEFAGDVTGQWDNITITLPVLMETTEFAGDVTGRWDNLTIAVTTNFWRYTETVPVASTSAAMPWTMSCHSTNLYICKTNNWAGSGTNWLRAALYPF